MCTCFKSLCCSYHPPCLTAAASAQCFVPSCFPCRCAKVAHRLLFNLCKHCWMQAPASCTKPIASAVYSHASPFSSSMPFARPQALLNASCDPYQGVPRDQLGAALRDVVAARGVLLSLPQEAEPVLRQLMALMISARSVIKRFEEVHEATVAARAATNALPPPAAAPALPAPSAVAAAPAPAPEPALATPSSAAVTPVRMQSAFAKASSAPAAPLPAAAALALPAAPLQQPAATSPPQPATAKAAAAAASSSAALAGCHPGPAGAAAEAQPSSSSSRSGSSSAPALCDGTAATLLIAAASAAQLAVQQPAADNSASSSSADAPEAGKFECLSRIAYTDAEMLDDLSSRFFALHSSCRHLSEGLRAIQGAVVTADVLLSVTATLRRLVDSLESPFVSLRGLLEDHLDLPVQLPEASGASVRQVMASAELQAAVAAAHTHLDRAVAGLAARQSHAEAAPPVLAMPPVQATPAAQPAQPVSTPQPPMSAVQPAQPLQPAAAPPPPPPAPHPPAPAAPAAAAGAAGRKTCGHCGVDRSGLAAGAKFKLCMGCRAARYCSVECQLAHWLHHQAECLAATAQLPATRADSG